MAKDQGQGVTRGNPVERKGEVGMADTATCNLYDNLVRAWGQDRECARLQSRIRGG